VLAGEPNGQIVLVLRPTSAVPDEMQMGRQFPTSIEGPDSRNSRLWLELWAGFAQKKSGPGSPSPERVQGRLQQLCLSCSSTTLSSPSPFVNGTNDVRTGSDVLHAMCFAVPRRNEPYSPPGAKLTSRVTMHHLGCALPDLIRFYFSCGNSSRTPWNSRPEEPCALVGIR